VRKVAFKKIRRNLDLLRRQFIPSEMKGSPDILQCPRCGKGPVYEAYFMSSPVVWCWNCGLFYTETEMLYTPMYSMSASTLELKNRLGPELKQMISEAEGQKREVGAMLCRTAAGQPHLSRACYGRRETVTVTDCHDGMSPLGTFHVHLGGTDVFSVPDLELAIKKEQLSCLGYTKTGQSYLKCIMPKRYYELPYETRAEIGRSLDQARQDIERANQLFRSSPSNPEAQSLSRRAQGTLRNVESLLQACEVPL